MALERRIARFPSWAGLTVLACAQVFAFSACVDRKAVGEDGEEEDAGPGWSDGALPPLTSTCPNQRGMVGIPFPDGACYLMDPWPVTRGEYLAALSAGPLVSSDSNCVDRSPGEGPRVDEFSSSSQPGAYCVVSRYSDEELGISERFDRRMPWPPSEEELAEPMVCVSWCDADAYCKRQGKRLCGNRVLDSDSAYDPILILEADNDEMYNACSGGGTRRSPLGGQVQSIGQNQVGRWEYLPLSRAQLTDAGEGAYQGLFGMRVGVEYSGPKYETIWTDYPSMGVRTPNRECVVSTLELWDLSRAYEPEHAYGGTTTFRCCADAVP